MFGFTPYAGSAYSDTGKAQAQTINFTGSSGFNVVATLSSAINLFGDSEFSAISIGVAFTKWEDDTLLFSFTDELLDEIDASFEQAGRVILAAQRTINSQPEIWVYWFNPTFGKFVFEKIALGRNPRCLLDDPFDTANSDVLIFYIRSLDQRICYRQQRDKFLIEYETPIVAIPFSYIDLYLQDIVKARDGRLVAIYAWHYKTKGTYAYGRLESTLYPITLPFESFSLGLNFIAGGSLQSLIKTVFILGQTPPTIPDAWITEDSFVPSSIIFSNSSALDQPVKLVGPPGSLDANGNPITYYDDVDAYKVADLVFQSGSLVVIVIEHTLFDIDAFTATTLVFQNSSSLIAVVIVVDLFDVDSFIATSIQFQAAGSSLA